MKRTTQDFLKHLADDGKCITTIAYLNRAFVNEKRLAKLERMNLFYVVAPVFCFFVGLFCGFLLGKDSISKTDTGDSSHYGPAEFAGIIDAPTVPEPLLPPEILAAVAVQESGGRHWRDGGVVIGQRGELGAMQIAPINWPACGGEGAIMDPAGNVRCADAMLLGYGALWGGERLIRALCRYNTGKPYYRCRYGLEVFEAIRRTGGQ